MRLTYIQIALVVLLSIAIGYYLRTSYEGFQIIPPLGSKSKKTTPAPLCPNCQTVCPECPPMADMTKYVLKTSIPPCPTCPDMSMYMLKTECPPSPDLTQFVLKSSIPKPDPIIIDNMLFFTQFQKNIQTISSKLPKKFHYMAVEIYSKFNLFLDKFYFFRIINKSIMHI
jgi:hypothetical protein